jgi:hypothetical protein
MTGTVKEVEEEAGVCGADDLRVAGAPLAPLSKTAGARTAWTMAEVSKHRTVDDCWLVVDGRVYDVTPYMAKHPGGTSVILKLAGLDATDGFHAYHAPRIAEKILPAFYIGTVSDWSVSPSSAEYRALRVKLEAAGAFETDYNYLYSQLPKFFGLVAFVLATVTGHHWLGVSAFLPLQLVGAIALGLFWQQLAFIGHDFGHNAVTHVRSTDELMGLVCGPLLTGISFSWCVPHPPRPAHLVSRTQPTPLPLSQVEADAQRAPPGHKQRRRRPRHPAHAPHSHQQGLLHLALLFLP